MEKKQKGIKKPSRRAITVNEDVWYYENRMSLDFVVWTHKDKEGQRQCVQFRLPLKKLLVKIIV